MQCMPGKPWNTEATKPLAIEDTQQADSPTKPAEKEIIITALSKEPRVCTEEKPVEYDDLDVYSQEAIKLIQDKKDKAKAKAKAKKKAAQKGSAQAEEPEDTSGTCNGKDGVAPKKMKAKVKKDIDRKTIMKDGKKVTLPQTAEIKPKGEMLLCPTFPCRVFNLDAP